MTKPMCTTVVWTMIVALFAGGCRDSSQQPRWYIPNSATDAAAGKRAIYGHYVCKDFIELVGARKSVRMARTRPVFLEIVFKPEYGDSVLLISAYQNFFALWKQRDTGWIEIKNVLPNRDVLLYIHEGNQEMSLSDTLKSREGGRLVHNWVFAKTTDEYPARGGNKPTVIYGWINREMIAGNYTLPGNPETVTFEPNGALTGWKRYNSYEVCLGGACFSLTDAPIDIITLSGNTEPENYGLIVGPDSLRFYSLASETPGKGYKLTVKEQAWALARK